MTSFLHRQGLGLAIALLLAVGASGPVSAQQIRLSDAQVDDVCYCFALYFLLSDDGKSAPHVAMMTRLNILRTRAGVSDEIYYAKLKDSSTVVLDAIVAAPDKQRQVESMLDDCARRMARLPDDR